MIGYEAQGMPTHARHVCAALYTASWVNTPPAFLSPTGNIIVSQHIPSLPTCLPPTLQVHRDIKPANFLIDRAWKVKVCFSMSCLECVSAWASRVKVKGC